MLRRAYDVYADARSELDGIVLRPVLLSEYPALADLVSEGLFPDGEQTLGGQWYHEGDASGNAHRTIAYHASSLSGLRPEAWQIPLGVYSDNELLGIQSLGASDYFITRYIETGSYLKASARGKGIGTTARTLALSLGFDVFGAQCLGSSAVATNRASRRVSEKLGYTLSGGKPVSLAGRSVEMLFYRLDRDDYLSYPARGVQHSGWDLILSTLGVEATPSALL